MRELLSMGEILRPYITDTSVLVNQAIEKGKKVMFEGAQGTMLDIDHGTYPYVTSSNCIAGGICTGVGVGPNKVQDVLGVMKAYTTRVGAGPFPTELLDQTGTDLMNKGGEFGATTGRPRRCGWLDMVIVEHAVRLNGLTQLAITKLDVLCGMKKIKVAIAYDIDGTVVDHFPASLRALQRAEPIYEELDGWEEWDDREAKRMIERGFEALPKNLRSYVKFVEERSRVKASIISIGKERDKTIDRRKV